jgi:cytochrome c oxidase subunit 2
MNRSVAFIFSIAVIAMLAAGFGLHAQESQPRVLAISAKRFEFTPSQVTVKRGEPVTLRVSAEDRDHGFYQKDMGIDLDLSPEHPSDVTITPEKAGRFVVICDHFCGSGHGNMKMVINVE